MLFFHWNAVSLLDDGTFFAAFHDYKITDDDAFVRRPDSPAIPREVLYAQGGQAVGNIADAPPMVCVDGILYRQSLQQIFYEEKKEEFRYLGTIQSDITNNQSATDGVPKEHLQANHPVVGAEVYQYGLHIVVEINGAYWLYEAVGPAPDAGAAGDSSLSPQERMLLDPSYRGPVSDEDSLSAAEAAARAYYAGTVLEVVSMEPISQKSWRKLTINIKK